MSSILILGAGGGYDIWAGFGLGRALAERSLHLVEGPKTEVKSETSPKIHWANYSWTDRLDLLDSKTNSRCTPFAIEIVPDSVPACKKQEEYFPEWALAKQLKQSVWAIRMVPPIVLVHTLTALVKRLNIDTIICIDAGSDALLFGDERKHERGSPTEEMTVLSAVYYLQSHSKIISQASIACISVSTEEIPLSSFFYRLGKLAALGGLQHIVPFPKEHYHDYRELLDSVPRSVCSIPNECILASLESRLDSFHLVNERLRERIGDGKMDYPPVFDWTKTYFVMDLDKLVVESNLLYFLYRRLCDPFNTQTGEKKNSCWMEQDDDDTQAKLAKISIEFHQTIMEYFDSQEKTGEMQPM